MAATVSLYDTLTREVRPLEPADGKELRFYCCGPTVYGPAHIGNFRTFLLQDTLRRTLEVAGHTVNHVRNITDVDDKTIRQSQEEGRALSEFTQYWTERFHEDCAALNMLPPTTEPRATEHIEEQVALIAQLVDKGHAYVGGDGSVYFRLCSCHDYGKLSHLKPDELSTQATNSAGQANDADEYERESISDFALWKKRKSEDGDNYWPSPWGEGRPGWHIECSAMSMKYLGESFDLHGGGIDLCFPHHENEIAQSECGTGQPFARHWFHCAHLMVEGKKMSKSLGNFWRLAEVRDKGFSPTTLRYALIAGHYRQQLNLTEHALQSAQSALDKLEKGVRTFLAKAGIAEDDFKTWNDQPSPLATTGVFEPAWARLANDLNVPGCLGEIFTSLKHLDRPDFDKLAMRGQAEALGGLLYALGLRLFTAEETPGAEIPEAVQALAQQRWEAKKNRDFTAADALRAEIQSHGWQVLDRKDGYDLSPAQS